ncbi:hypothetical protein D3C85_737810 [compost metagenome]
MELLSFIQRHLFQTVRLETHSRWDIEVLLSSAGNAVTHLSRCTETTYDAWGDSQPLSDVVWSLTISSHAQSGVLSNLSHATDSHTAGYSCGLILDLLFLTITNHLNRIFNVIRIAIKIAIEWRSISVVVNLLHVSQIDDLKERSQVTVTDTFIGTHQFRCTTDRLHGSTVSQEYWTEASSDPRQQVVLFFRTFGWEEFQECFSVNGLRVHRSLTVTSDSYSTLTQGLKCKHLFHPSFIRRSHPVLRHPEIEQRELLSLRRFVVAISKISNTTNSNRTKDQWHPKNTNHSTTGRSQRATHRSSTSHQCPTDSRSTSAESTHTWQHTGSGNSTTTKPTSSATQHPNTRDLLQTTSDFTNAVTDLPTDTSTRPESFLRSTFLPAFTISTFTTTQISKIRGIFQHAGFTGLFRHLSEVIELLVHVLVHGLDGVYDSFTTSATLLIKLTFLSLLTALQNISPRVITVTITVDITMNTFRIKLSFQKVEDLPLYFQLFNTNLDRGGSHLLIEHPDTTVLTEPPSHELVSTTNDFTDTLGNALVHLDSKLTVRQRSLSCELCSLNTDLSKALTDGEQ